MRLLLLAALACAIIALICAAVPTTIAIGPLGWIAASLVAYFADLLYPIVMPTK